MYKKLLYELTKKGYKCIPFEDFLQNPQNDEKTAILRHDVDKKPMRSLRTAEMENGLGIRGTYYFRVFRDRVPTEAIRRVAAFGHEIGYHYEDLDTAGGSLEAALASFQRNLARLRTIAPVRTICMHGSPLSRHDNRNIWRERDYREFGLIGEPYFDIDFKKVLYLTDTGRRWDGGKVSIRDRVSDYGREVRGDRENRGQETEDRGQKIENRRQKTEDREDFKKGSRDAICSPFIFSLHSTFDILKALKNDLLPEKIMLTIHPQRWNDSFLHWMKEFIFQNMKNSVKMWIKHKKTEPW